MKSKQLLIIVFVICAFAILVLVSNWNLVVGSAPSQPSNNAASQSLKLEEPILRALTPEELKFLQSTNVDIAQLPKFSLIFPASLNSDDNSQKLQLTEKNILGSWKRWQLDNQKFNQITMTFLPEGKLNFLTKITELNKDGSPSANVTSDLTAGTWKLKEGFIHYEMTNLVTTAEKVISVTERRLTCISGLNGEKYVMHRFLPQ